MRHEGLAFFYSKTNGQGKLNPPEFQNNKWSSLVTKIFFIGFLIFHVPHFTQDDTIQG